jgi:hypothetical protein
MLQGRVVIRAGRSGTNNYYCVIIIGPVAVDTAH